MRSTLIPAKFASRLVPSTHTKQQVVIHLVTTDGVPAFKCMQCRHFGLGELDNSDTVSGCQVPQAEGGFLASFRLKCVFTSLPLPRTVTDATVVGESSDHILGQYFTGESVTSSTERMYISPCSQPASDQREFLTHSAFEPFKFVHK
jgi:hypothetical protein